VAAGLFVGLAAGDEELAAARGERGVNAPPHLGDRQEAEQHKVNQRDQQLFQNSQGFLMRDSTRQVGSRFFKKSGHARQRVGRHAHVGVEEDEQGMAGLLGQHPASVLLAAPAGRKLGRGD
jgi:hypothetical protein